MMRDAIAQSHTVNCMLRDVCGTLRRLRYVKRGDCDAPVQI